MRFLLSVCPDMIDQLVLPREGVVSVLTVLPPTQEGSFRDVVRCDVLPQRGDVIELDATRLGRVGLTFIFVSKLNKIDTIVQNE